MQVGGGDGSGADGAGRLGSPTALRRRVADALRGSLTGRSRSLRLVVSVVAFLVPWGIVLAYGGLNLISFLAFVFPFETLIGVSLLPFLGAYQIPSKRDLDQ